MIAQITMTTSTSAAEALEFPIADLLALYDALVKETEHMKSQGKGGEPT